MSVMFKNAVFLDTGGGLISRYLSHIKYEYYVSIARRRGANIGHDVLIPDDTRSAFR